MEEVDILVAKDFEREFRNLHNIPHGKDRYFDLVKFLLHKIPFKFNIRFFGSRKGVVELVQGGYADVGLIVVQPTPKNVGGSLPFSYTYTTIMTSKPPDNPVPLFYGLDHIRPLAFPLILGCILGFALFLKINNRHEIRISRSRNEKIRNQSVGIIYYLFQILGSIFLKSFERLPKNIGGQLAIGTWMLLIFVFSTTYLGFLKSSYSVSINYPINSFEDLLKYPKLPVLFYRYGWTQRYLENCKDTDKTCKTLRYHLCRDAQLPITNYTYHSLNRYFELVFTGCAMIGDLYSLRNTVGFFQNFGYKKEFFRGTKQYFPVTEHLAVSPYARQDIKEFFNYRILRFFETNQEFVSISRKPLKVIMNSDYPTADVDGFMELGMTHFKPLAYILLLGLALASVAVVVEIIAGFLHF